MLIVIYLIVDCQWYWCSSRVSTTCFICMFLVNNSKEEQKATCWGTASKCIEINIWFTAWGTDFIPFWYNVKLDFLDLDFGGLMEMFLAYLIRFEILKLDFWVGIDIRIVLRLLISWFVLSFALLNLKWWFPTHMLVDPVLWEFSFWCLIWSYQL